MTDQSLFRAKSPWIMKGLIAEFGISEVQAAAVLGNIGHECNGFHDMQEIKPIKEGAGGYGWCQWTGARRRQFEDFADKNGWTYPSDKANYNYLLLELHNTERSAIKAVRKQNELKAAVRSFEQHFERAHPSYKHYDSRYVWAGVALGLEGGASFEIAEAILGDEARQIDFGGFATNDETPGAGSNVLVTQSDRLAAAEITSRTLEQLGSGICDGKGQDDEERAEQMTLEKVVIQKPEIKEFIPARYFSHGRSVPIRRIVVHYTTADNAQSTISEFTRIKSDPKDVRSSSHYLVDRNGDLYQFVLDSDVANHAKQNNIDSIGIEHVAAQGQKITQDQSNTSALLIKWLMNEYAIPKGSVLAHKCTMVDGHFKNTDCCGDLFLSFGAGRKSDCSTTKTALNNWLSANGI